MELEELPGSIFRHVEVNSASGIIPVNVDATEEGTIPVHGDGEVFFEALFEMDDMFLGCRFNAKVVDDKT